MSLATLSSLSATTYTFEGAGGDDLYTNTSNWDIYPGLIISQGDTLLIASQSCRLTYQDVLEFAGVLSFTEWHHEFINDGLFFFNQGGIIENDGFCQFINQSYFEIGYYWDVPYFCIENYGTVVNYFSFLYNFDIYGGYIENYGDLDYFNQYIESDIRNDGFVAFIQNCSIIYGIENFGSLYNGGYLQIENDIFSTFFNGGSFGNSGTIENHTVFVNNDILSNENAFLNYGRFTSPGTFLGSFTNKANGILDPGISLSGIYDYPHGIGTISIDSLTDFGEIHPGNLTFESGSSLEIEIESDDSFDKVIVSDTVSFSGTLNVDLINNYFPEECREFEIITYGHYSGVFENIVINNSASGEWDLEYFDTVLVLNYYPSKGLDNCLDFDGVDDELSITENIGEVQTIEFRFFPENADPNNPVEPIIIINGDEDFGIFINDAIPSISGETFSFIDPSGNGIYLDYQFTSQWYHIAIQGTGGKFNTIMINGEVISSESTNSFPQYPTITQLSIGGNESSSYFHGKIDELRLWNPYRMLDSISKFYDYPLQGNESNLQYYLTLNQGIPSGNNYCIDYSRAETTSNSGSLQNFALNGANSNWVKSDCTLPRRINKFIPMNGDWNNYLNWNLGIVPSYCHDVSIPAASTVTIQTAQIGYCYSVLVESGAFIIIKDGANLNIVE